MIEDDAPPNPLPPAAQSPYPDRTQHPPHDAPRLPAHVPEGPAIGALGITLIGGAIAAGLGLLIAIPLLRRKSKPAPRPTPQARCPRRKRSD